MFVTRKFKRLKIIMKTPISKPGNGAINNGNVDSMLVLSDGRFLIKGLRGLLNHAMMAVAKQKGIEVCHSSDKKETQTGEDLLPKGYHLNGACYPENECIRHKLMGSLKKQSVLRFEPVVVAYEKTKENVEGAQKMQIATEKRIALVAGSKRSIQDFGERFVSGKFTLQIELLRELTKEELIFLLQSILFMPELGLGGSVNNGAGKIILEEVALQEVLRSRKITKGKVVEEEQTRNLWKEMESVMDE
ncbi:MAG: hypothetical protein JXA54_07715 [Candidatus Heimdallarchaeota archaeon]|nr:hypothetical protein [Candidatus Heimdallarchaeota archaeon]